MNNITEWKKRDKAGQCGSANSTVSQLVFFFFFSSRRRHTRFDCDWSSDVCSSDLPPRRLEFIMTTPAALVSLLRPFQFKGKARLITVPKSGFVTATVCGSEFELEDRKSVV